MNEYTSTSFCKWQMCAWEGGKHSMERLQLVGLYRCLVLMEVCEWILGAIMMSIIVRVDGLRFKPGDGIELLDCGCAQPRQGSEDGTLYLRNLGVLYRVHEGVLRLCRVVLQLLCGVLLAERGDFVEVHFEVVRHLLRKLVFRSRFSPALQAIAHLHQRNRDGPPLQQH